MVDIPRFHEGEGFHLAVFSHFRFLPPLELYHGGENMDAKEHETLFVLRRRDDGWTRCVKALVSVIHAGWWVGWEGTMSEYDFVRSRARRQHLILSGIGEVTCIIGYSDYGGGFGSSAVRQQLNP